MENNKEISKMIEEVEKVSILLEAIGNLSSLQLDYIDFEEYSDKTENDVTNALLTLNELLRTKSEHITLGHVIDEKIAEADKQVQKILKTLYSMKKETTKEDNNEDTEA